MIDFLVCDTEADEMENVHDACFNYCFQKNYDAEVYGFDNVSEADDYISKQSMKIACRLACGTPVDELIDDIREQNPSNYVVLIAQNLMEIVKYTTPVVRPVGCLLKPVKAEDVHGVIDSIAADLNDDDKNQGIFQFKIRSREYYVDCSQIIMFEAVSKKIVLYTAVQEYEFYDSITNIIGRLPESFFRCQKSYIVNMTMVREVDYKEMLITLEDNLSASLSRNVKAEFAERMERYKKG